MTDAGKAVYKLLWKKWWGNQKCRNLEGCDNKLISFFSVDPSDRVYGTNYKNDSVNGVKESEVIYGQS